MKLIECYIENFGTLSKCEYSFKHGINCFVSDNGTGKTTLTVFLASMLYGLPDTRKQSIDENERKKYTPWQGGRFGGTLTIEVRGKEYIIERSFGAKAQDDTFALYERTSGKPSTDFTEKLGEELFGIDRDGFLLTVFLSEKNLSSRSANQTVSAKLSNLVGVEGDIGAYDAARRLLEEKRKHYYKQSENCEIARVRAKIRDKKFELDRLSVLLDTLEIKDKEIASKRLEIEKAKKEKEALTEMALESAKARTKYAAEEQYIEMQSGIEKKEAELTALREFFRGEIPEGREVERIRYAKAEGERIKEEEAREIGGEYLELSKIYGDNLDFDVILKAENALGDAIAIDGEIREIESGQDATAEKMRELFVCEVPKKDEVEAVITGLRENKGITPLLTTIVGILLLFGGVALGNAISPVLFSLVVVGAGLFCTGIVLNRKFRNKGERKAKDFLRSLSRDSENYKEALARVLSDIELYRTLSEEREKRKTALCERRDGLYRMLREFTASFNISECGDIGEDIKRIHEGYTRFYKLRLENETNLDGRQTRLATAEGLLARAYEFLDNFNTKTDNPFDEIAANVEKYRILSLALERERTLALEFKEKYGTTGILPAMQSENGDVREMLSAAEEKYNAVTQELGALLEDYERTAREAEATETVKAELVMLEEKLKKYLEIYATIQKTAQLLSEAYENMNAKYIGKTRERFLKYEAAVGGDGGSYTVGCDFEVQKNEMGAMHKEESYSRGTRDLISLAMRLALTDSLFEGEEPFIILDDPFISLDDTKIKKGRALLEELGRERQVLYFTCSSSRKI